MFLAVLRELIEPREPMPGEWPAFVALCFVIAGVAIWGALL